MYQDYQFAEEGTNLNWVVLIIGIVFALISSLAWIWLLYNTYKIKQGQSISAKGSYYRARQSLFAGNIQEAKEFYLKAIFSELNDSKSFKEKGAEARKLYIEKLFKDRKYKVDMFGITVGDINVKAFHFG